jgi:hypothetical protein
MIPAINTADGRRAWAFLAILGGCLTMTVFAAVGVYLVSGNEEYSFWLAMAAHAQILLGISVFGAQFVKRTIKAGRSGLEISDHGGEAVQAAEAVADAAVTKAEEIKEEVKP